jgi:hypothetical protein
VLDKTSESKVEVAAISVQYAVSFSDSRHLTLTTGVPLDADPREINPVLDKLVDCVERQRDRYNLTQARNLLLNAEQDLHAHKMQFADAEIKMMAEWVDRNRQGEWRATGAQKQQLDNLKKNQDTATERIKQLRKTITELEEKCR